MRRSYATTQYGHDSRTFGYLTEQEAADAKDKISKEIDALTRKSGAPPKKKNPTELFSEEIWRQRSARGGIPLTDLADKPKEVVDLCAEAAKLYIRKDSLDTFLYDPSASSSKASGASVNFTKDYVAGSTTANIDGMISYVFRHPCLPPPNDDKDLHRPYLSGFAIAPSITAHGNLNEQHRDKEKSSLVFGLDTQFETFGGRFLDYSYLTISPFAQTDLRGIANVGGAKVYWDPTLLALRLGGNRGWVSENFDWFWQFRAEADYVSVSRVGETNLVTGNYQWLGATIRANATLFPGNTSVPEFLQNRIHLIATIQKFWDARAGGSIYKYTGAVAYNLSNDGSSSVSVEYDRGTDKDTLAGIQQYLVKLNYKY